MNDYNFGNFLCFLREKKGLTQADIAQLLNITPAAVSKWENGASKPRVEVLFQLAGILEVKPEELMEGRYIVEETLDPDVVRQINERYEYLIKIDSYATVKVKMKRFLAFIIDWNLIGLSVIILLSSFLDSVTIDTSNLKMLFSLSIMSLFPILLILRDLIMGGRSLGKRITGLIVLDKNTGDVAKPIKLFVRNLFLFLVQIDAVILLASGSSIGDRIANTVVVLKKDSDDITNSETEPIPQKVNEYSAPKPLPRKKIGIIVAIIAISILLFISFILGLIFSALEAEKNTAEYKLAYNYVIDSNTFKELGIAESKIKIRSFSKTAASESNGKKERTAEYGFFVSGKMYYVICHYQDNEWIVCNECTKFH